MSTSDKLNNILNAKNSIRNAIKSKGVDISEETPLSQYANKISLIQVGNGDSSDPIDANPYYIEYRVIDSNHALNDGTSEYKYGLPRVYSTTSNYTYTYDKVEIELKDGTITDNLGTLTKDVYKIRLWYPENTVALKFYGSSTYTPLVCIVDYIKTDNFTSMSYMFYFSRLCYIDMKKSSFNTSNVTDMSYMFYYNSRLSLLDASNWVTSNVTDMRYIFYGCSSLTSLDLSSFNTSKVTDMRYMFRDCSSLTSLDLSNFDTSKVTNMEYMFYNCNKLTSLDLSNFDNSNVTNMQYMFGSCSSLTSLDLSNFDTSNVTNMGYMFKECRSLTSLDLSSFDTGKVTIMSDMFYSCSSLTSLDISKWDMTKTSTYSSMFGSSLSSISGLKYINLSNSNDGTINKIVTRLYTRSKTTYGEMIVPETTSESVTTAMAAKYWKPVGPIILPTSFEIVSELDEIVGIGKSTKLHYGNFVPWHTSGEVEFISSNESIAYINENNELISVAYGSVEVYGRIKNNIDVVSNTLAINVSETDSYPNVIKFRSGTTSPGNNNYIKVNSASIKLTAMSYNSLSKIYTYDVKAAITSIRFNGSGSNSYGNNIKELIKLNTSNMTDMSYMFNYCNQLTSLDLSNWDVSKVTTMNHIFYSCSKLTSLDVSNWDTSNVTNMEYAFSYCNQLTSLDLSNWDVSKVTTMNRTFSNCSNLSSLIISKWNTNSLSNITDMFANCSSLNFIDMSESDDRTISNILYNQAVKTKTSYGEMVVPETTSETVVKSILAKYWKPIGVTINGRFEIASELDEIVGIGKSTKLHYGNFYPWYIEDEIEFISSDESIAYINDNNEVVSVSYGSIEIYGRINDVVSNTLTVSVSETDSYPNVIKIIFSGNVTSLNVNSTYINCHGINSISRVSTFISDDPITKIGLDGSSLLKIVKLNTSNITDMSEMFSNCHLLTSLDLSNWDTSNVTDMSGIFKSCSNLTYLNISNWDTSNVTNMNYMFGNNPKLTKIEGIEALNTNNVYYMDNMFYNCSSLTSLDLSKWNFVKINGSLNSMFSNCSSLTSLDLPNWEGNNNYVNNMSEMFSNCSSLTSLDLSNWVTSNLQYMHGMFYNCSSLTSLDLSNFDTSNVTTMSDMFSNVPTTVDWNYDGTNYQNWTLTESESSYTGTFPWNQ